MVQPTPPTARARHARRLHRPLLLGAPRPIRRQRILRLRRPAQRAPAGETRVWDARRVLVVTHHHALD
eukprot:4624422-Prymnesium_polylepis.1